MAASLGSGRGGAGRRWVVGSAAWSFAGACRLVVGLLLSPGVEVEEVEVAKGRLVLAGPGAAVVVLALAAGLAVGGLLVLQGRRTGGAVLFGLGLIGTLASVTGAGVVAGPGQLLAFSPTSGCCSSSGAS